MNRISPFGSRRSLVFLLILAITISAPRWCYSFTPNSPKVRALCDAAAKYLASPASRNAPQMRHYGGWSLLAYALFKYGKRYGIDNTKHPRVLEAIKAIEAIAKSPRGLKESDNYNLSVGLILLIEFDAENVAPRYRREILAMLKELKSRQRADGAWSYLPAHPTGDTSQTQYAVLALFTAKQFGFDVATDQLAKVCNWLLRTQDPKGSWGYQGQDPGVGNFDRMDQSINQHASGLERDNHNTAHSDAAAGVGSLYITAKMLRFTRQSGAADAKPKARGSLKTKKQKASDVAQPLTKQVSAKMLLERMGDADRWFADHYSIPAQRWQYYYLYTFERYQSFRELREGREKQLNVKWYNDGVNFLASTQLPDGAWKGRKGGRMVDTSLALLFLVRSTKLVIGVPIKASFRGGRNLPDDTSYVEMQQGNIVDLQEKSEGMAGTIEQLTALLHQQRIDPDSIKAFDEDMLLSEEQKARRLMQMKFRKLLGAKEAEQRLIAAKALARQANAVDHVPALIYALSDPDRRVALQARDALRAISRKFAGVGMRDDYDPRKPEMKEHLRDVQGKWRSWYSTVRPYTNALGLDLR